ncbi:integrase arm-type DNA-binding domain-containing protein [Geomonas oryzisoli]|uniref:Integrase arm-type DNA-binding domain-containing protein n=1 Tax=Geomonas oryzisoli TaxID=2847992 RepID=A0ABX8J4F2_9BACT|nr:site-specific integrase [Geomonas oryzisoli]QWV92886.1 integrase arm-type DNA-binding domain-containing protein [Geomonas oryzisoli]
MFTDKYIKALKPKAGKYYEREGNGFAIRVMPSAAKTWLFIYTFDGKRRELALGPYPDVSLKTARERHAEAVKILNNGKNPGALEEEKRLERKRTPFVADFIEEYLQRHAKDHNRGWKEIERALKANILPKWGKRKITDIRRRDLVLILDEVADRGAPVMANRLLAYTRKMFSYAVKRDVLEVNPFMGMDRPEREHSRERVLSATEIRTFWRNLDEARMSDSVRRALKLILVTGQRPGEVIGMHRREIDGDWWMVPGERSKNKQAHRVYLTRMAQELIGDATEYIFPSPRNEGKPLEVRTLTSAIKDNLPHRPESRVEDLLGIPHFVPHDLRRTAATCWAEMGVPGELIDRLQNHITRQKQGVGHVYNRYTYDREKREAMESWERKLTMLTVAEPVAKVIRLPR